MDHSAFVGWITGELAELPGVEAVALGGSRAQGTHRPDSDWDVSIYYRAHFDPSALRAKGWDGTVFDVGAWGGGVMNGGAWLSIDGRAVDVHYRDLDDVEHWCEEAEAGRFTKQLLLFYTAGIPTYVVMGELAVNQVLAGRLPRPDYPAPLADAATTRWHDDAVASLAYARNALAAQRDVTVALANASRAILEAAHGIMAHRSQWVLNEKGLARRAGLEPLALELLAAAEADTLGAALDRIEAAL